MTATPWETVHVFISSTFNDMHAERDYLVKRVFPELREWCEHRRLRLVDIDLRWGVTEADATHNRNVVQVCLDRIDQCRPFFLCFLGQRYGWVPRHVDVSRDTFLQFPELARVVSERRSVTEMEVLHAVVAPFRATHRSRMAGVADTLRRWWTAGHAAPEQRGADLERTPADHAFFYLRSRSHLPSVPDAPAHLRRIYSDDFETDTAVRDELIRRQSRLREEIVPGTGRPVRVYDARWLPDRRTREIALPLACPSALPENQQRWRDGWERLAGIQVEGLSIEPDSADGARARDFNERLTRGRLGEFTLDERVLGEVVQEDLKRAIEQRFPDHVEVAGGSPLQRELDRQALVLFESAEGFIEREGDFDDIDEYADGESNQLFALTAPAGVGKSSLLANWVVRRMVGEQEAVHARFIGTSDGSDSVDGLLRSLLDEMQSTAALPEDAEIPSEPLKLRFALPKLLGTLGERRKVLVVLDAVNQLTTGLSDVGWLPTVLPPGVKLVVSFKTGDEEGDRLAQQFRDDPQVRLSTVRPLAELEDRRKLVRAHLSQYLKELDDHHLEALIRTEGASNPLYIKVVLSELQVFGAFEQIGRKIREDFGGTPVSAFDAVLRRLEADEIEAPLPAPCGIAILFGLLTEARRGLTAPEIAEMIRLDLDLSLESRPDILEAVTAWVRQVRPFLARRDGRLDFYYESFQLAARDRYVLEGDGAVESCGRSVRAWHRALAGYFDRALLKGKVEGRAELTRRGVSERCYHLAHAGRVRRYVSVLTDFESLLTRIEFTSPLEMDEDFAHAVAADLPLGDHTRGLELLRGALRLSARILAADPSQLGPQLVGRLALDDAPELWRVWEQAMLWERGAWMRPLWPCLRSPGGAYTRTLHGHAAPVSAVAISPDGRHLVSGSQDHTLALWDFHTGRKVREFKGHTKPVTAVAVTPDGSLAVSACSGSSIFVWDLASGRKIDWSNHHWKRVNSLALSPDGLTVVSGSLDTTISIWNRGERVLGVASIRGATRFGEITAVAMSHDGRRVVAAHGDRVVRVWDLQSKELLFVFEGHTDRVTAVLVTPDDRRIVSASCDKTVRVWDISTGQLQQTLEGHTDVVNDIAVTPDGRSVLSVSSDKTLAIWDLYTGDCTSHVGSTEAIVSVACAADGPWAVSGARDLTMAVWDISKQHELHPPVGHDESIKAIALTPDGTSAVTASWDHTLALWDLASRKRLRRYVGHTNYVTSLSITPDGRRLVSGSADRTIGIWDIASGERLHTLEGHDDWIWAVGVTAGGRRLLSGAQDGTVTLWDMASGTRVHTWEAHSESVRAIGTALRSYRAVSAALDGSLVVWDLWDVWERDKEHVLKGQSGSIQSVVLSQNGRMAVSGAGDGTLAVWDLESGRQIKSIAGNMGTVFDVCLTQDEARVISASADGSLALWDIESGKLLAKFTGEAGLLACACVGDTVVAGDNGGRLYGFTLEDRGGAGSAPVYIRNAGTVYRAPDMDTLRAWTRQGRVLATDRLSFDREHWFWANNHPELRVIFDSRRWLRSSGTSAVEAEGAKAGTSRN